MAIPNYWLGHQPVPRKFHIEYWQSQRSFLWHDNKSVHGLTPICWDQATRAASVWGLGLRDLRSQIRSFQANNIWRFLQNLDAYRVRLLSQKYPRLIFKTTKLKQIDSKFRKIMIWHPDLIVSSEMVNWECISGSYVGGHSDSKFPFLGEYII